MKKQVLFLLLLCTLFGGKLFAQAIVNGGFETGPVVNNYNQLFKATGWESGCSLNGQPGAYFVGTPDLYDGNCPTASMDLPAGNRLNPRLSGTQRFAGMLGPISTAQRRESIINNVDAPFVKQYVYTLSFYVARTYQHNGQAPNIQMEAVLRKSGSCTYEKLIPINIDIAIQNFGNGEDPNDATNNWTLLTAEFFLVDADVPVGYDQIEIRPKFDGAPMGETVYVDDAEITWRDRSLACVEPVGSTGTISMPSKYGPQDITRFCGPEVFVDGSCSTNETNYTIAISSFDLMAWQDVTYYFQGNFSGIAPNSIDLMALMNGIPWQAGTVYHLSLIVGPHWDGADLWFVVEECCPANLEFAIDCETSQLSITNMPSGATGAVLWFLDNTLVGNTSPYGTHTLTTSGTYGALALITLPNGDQCQIGTDIEYHESQCCEVNGPSIEADFIVHPTYPTELVPTIPWGELDLPVLCGEVNIGTETTCEEGYKFRISSFDPINWNDIPGFIYDSGWILSPTPSTIDITNYGPYTPGEWYMVAITVGGYGQNSTKHLVFKYTDCARRVGQFEPATLDHLNAISMVPAPNPTSSKVTLSMSEVCSGTIQITSIDGKVLETSTINESNQAQIDLSDYPAGLYFARLVTETGDIISTKIVRD